MGAYDEYGVKGIQIKAGACEMKNYAVGDKCDLMDGVYLAYEGIIVVKNNVFIAEFNKDQLLHKWGNQLDLQKIVDGKHWMNDIKEEDE